MVNYLHYEEGDDELDEKRLQNLEDVFSLLMRSSISKWANTTEDCLSASQYLVLKLLKEDGSKKMSDLAEFLEITTSAITGLSNKLIKLGYVERIRDGQDRRVVHLAITDEGVLICDKISKKRQGNIKSLHENLSDEEIDFLIKIYNKLI